MTILEPGALLGRKSGLVVRTAINLAEIRAAQHLRYRVFYEELDAQPQGDSNSRLDSDRFDAICDHLLVVQETGPLNSGSIAVSGGELVGTYRLLRQSVANANGGFYTSSEFDIEPLLARKPGLQFLELGRSCVLKPYRTKPVVELLWQGIWNYVRLYNLDVMLGCASLEGTDPEIHAMALSFMAQNCAAPEDWHVKALPSRYIEMNRIPREQIDVKSAMKALPPLIKGYLRLGCYIGDGAVVDQQFNTIDVLIILPVTAIDPRYFAHFGKPEDKPVPVLSD